VGDAIVSERGWVGDARTSSYTLTEFPSTLSHG